MKKHFYIFSLILACAFLNASAQTDYTNKINNPSFETANLTGWTFFGTTGFAWVGVNTDGDATKTGSYIAGIWNATISDVELSQTITGLTNGMYVVTADLMGSKNATTSRLTTQRLFANGVSMLFGTQTAYSTENLAILNQFESYSFGEYAETLSDVGPFKKLTLTTAVTNGTLSLGIKTNGKSSALGFSFPNLTAGDGHGWFKVDNFTLTHLGELTTEIQSNAYLRSIRINNGTLSPIFNREVNQYNVLLAAGTLSVQPSIIAEVSGVQIMGSEVVEVSLGSGKSTITVTSVDGTVTKTYTVNYAVSVPAVLTGTQQDRLYSNEFQHCSCSNFNPLTSKCIWSY